MERQFPYIDPMRQMYWNKSISFPLHTIHDFFTKDDKERIKVVRIEINNSLATMKFR